MIRLWGARLDLLGVQELIGRSPVPDAKEGVA
ncbi:hypothetical protein COMA2_120057 [Candidatus Nitrospira nitrificans]|uniref:Uncharacterized protein n=1 Tax=Candidatus Nitrospira nitrificans TaxID=1742973 RepID=A0A0S4LB50_9BACT|nr:hypothetical protein COMA2_120057 [Candidatus Nitrospira nitrificans]